MMDVVSNVYSINQVSLIIVMVYFNQNQSFNNIQNEVE